MANLILHRRLYCVQHSYEYIGKVLLFSDDVLGHCLKKKKKKKLDIDSKICFRLSPELGSPQLETTFENMTLL